jgi:hypothetical protein
LRERQPGKEEIVPNTYTNAKPKASLKLVAPKSNNLRLGGVAPTNDMAPGKYVVICETAWIEAIGKEHRAVFQFRVVDGEHDGVGLRQWVMAANGGGVVSPTSRYARYCALALGRPLESADPVDDPSQIFSGRFFCVQVGFRKTEKPKGGRSSDKLALIKKGDGDYLRVHDILTREDL